VLPEHDQRFHRILNDYLERPAGDYAELLRRGYVSSPDGVDLEQWRAEIRAHARKGTSESKRARSNAFYLSPSPTARNHWESGPSGGRTNQHDSEQAPLGSAAARPAPEPACDATKYLQM